LPPPDHGPGSAIIRRPFSHYPGAPHPNSAPLTFEMFHANPNWFVVVEDFLMTNGHATVPDAEAYPESMMPSRGWPPKDQPHMRVRCTFCHKDYGGPNAKSMWRRHVTEQHHVVLA
ncbi:hypothetical protein FISHEDRAFT_28951, partial [Fistulina hepatica ATCC 64428]